MSVCRDSYINIINIIIIIHTLDSLFMRLCMIQLITNIIIMILDNNHKPNKVLILIYKNMPLESVMTLFLTSNK